MKWLGYAMVGLLGAVLGVVATRRGDSSNEQGSMDPSALRQLESIDTSLSTLVAILGRRSPQPVEVQSGAEETTLPPTRSKEADSTNDSLDARIRQGVDEVVAELSALRDTIHGARESFGSSQMTLHQRIVKASGPRWNDIDRFTAGCESDYDQWVYRAKREVMMMTEAEVVDRFGAPTDAAPGIWYWNRKASEMHAGCVTQLEIQFVNGTAIDVKIVRGE
jgi:hypothetical protein